MNKFDVAIIGGPGIVVMINGYLAYVFSFEFKEGKINSIYMVANPDKLSRLNENIQRDIQNINKKMILD
ncbi:hypothetical protein SAMN04488168_11235 [Bacillus sp. 491mf]|uniref:hypothetical protein n=1 Tax=Bacillus TaxID=1386 RepID=UPI000554880E|nr:MULTISPECIES: hypothetical protein [unclassified Bacillus (in: firmicutes)]SFC92547.1 hypothetical protein SAMN04488168_11235 [Bacillus sp. 491mf]